MSKISFVGDLCLKNPEEVNLSSTIRYVLKECEYNVLNFEAPLKSDDSCAIAKSGPALFQSDDSPEWIVNNGWNIISVANNHFADYGEKSILKTLHAFENVFVIGGGYYSDSYKINTYVLSSGIKIGILACCQKEFGALDAEDTSNRLGYAWICHPEIIRLIVEKKCEVDKLIVYAHAGVERFPQPLPEWRKYYKFLIDLGCDAVVASHPHIIQGWEMYKGKPIIYSLGNFCFQKQSYNGDSSWLKSLMCVFDFSMNGELTFEMIPLIYDVKRGVIDVDSSITSKKNIDNLNKVLNDSQLYDSFINLELPKEWKEYLHLFANSDFRHAIFSHDMLSFIKRKMLGKKCDFTHLLNNLQNESHRWAIERIINVKYLNR
jgi:hypothetical protein